MSCPRGEVQDDCEGGRWAAWLRASPLWTLQRLCFEPDVAADTSDRGENHDPGQANKKKASGY